MPNRTSPRFNNPSASVPSVTFANDQVYAFRNEHTAQLYLNIYKQTTTPACLQQGLLRAHTSRTAQVQVSVSEITNLAGIGNDEVGYALTEHVAEQGGEVTVVIDVATVRIGRAVVTFDVSNTDQALPQGLSAVTSVVDRLDNLTNA